jgi:hypothetical protein
VLLAGAHVTGDGLVVIRPLGCANKEVGTFELPAGEPGAVSRIDLDPGAYQLDVFARFASNDGRHGDLSGALGILVDPDQKRDILPARLFPVCQFPS